MKSDTLKKKSLKNSDIYISDEEEKQYDSYKNQLNYIESMNKVYLENQFLNYLKKDHKIKVINTFSEKPCCEFNCKIF